MDIQGLNINFGIEENGIQRNVTDIKRSFRGLNSDLKLTDKIFKSSEKSIDNYNDELGKLGSASKILQNNLDGLQSEMAGLDTTTAKGKKKATQLKNEFNKQSIAALGLQNRIDELGDEYKDLAFQATLAGKAVRHAGNMKAAWGGMNDSINRIGDSFRNLGYVSNTVMKGMVVSNISTIVPVAGSAVSAIAGIGGALAAVSGGAIGLGGAFGVAYAGIGLFAGQAKTALQMVEDGEMRATNELTRYQSSLSGLQTQWKDLAQSNQAGIFNTMSNGIDMASVALTRLTPFITKTTNQIASMSRRMRDWVTSSTNATTAFKLINNIGPPIFQNILNSIFKVTDGLVHMANQFAPLFTWVGAGLESMANKFNTWANSAGTDNSISRFIDYTMVNLPIVGQIFGNVFSGIVSLFQAFSGHSHDVLVGMQGVTQTFKEWAANLSGTEGFKNFISYLNTNGPKVWQLLKNIGTIAVNVIQGLAPVGSVMLSITTAITGFIAKLTESKVATGLFLGVGTALVGTLMTFGPMILIVTSALKAYGFAMSGVKAITTIATGVTTAFKLAQSAAQTVTLAYMFAMDGLKARFIALNIQQRISMATQSLWNTVTNLGKSIANGYRYAVAWLSTTFTAANLKQKAGMIIQGAWNTITATGRAVTNGYRYAIAALTTSQTVQTLKTKIAAAATVAWTVVTKAAAIATRGLGLAIRFMTGPVGIVITAVGLLVAGIVHLWKTNATFRNAVISIWNSIKNAAVVTFGAIKTFIVNAWNSIKYWSVTIWNGIKNAVLKIIRLYVAGIKLYIYAIKTVITTVFNFIRTWSVRIWNGIKNSVVNIVRVLSNSVRSIFNGLKNGVVRIISTLRSWLISAWSYIRNKTVSLVSNMWNRIKSIFNVLSKVTRTIFSNLRSFLFNTWSSIKNGVVSRVRTLWSVVKSIWNTLSKITRTIFNNLKSFMLNLWSTVRNRITSSVRALWNNVRNTWNSLRKGTSNIFNGVKNNLIKTWNTIKSRVTGIASSLWGAVRKTFTNMRNGLKGLADKIGGTINNMVKGIKKGLNSLIKGVNWVAKKLGVDTKIPQLHTGTAGATASNSVVSNGAISSPTLATVNDRGTGNGTGINGHQEVIQKADGSMYAPKGRNVTVPLGKGDVVHNGKSVQKAQKAGLLPKFASGTGRDFSKELLKKKKKKNHEHALDAIGAFGPSGGGLKDAVAELVGTGVTKSKKAAEKVGDVAQGAKAAASTAGSWVKDKATDLLEFVGNPGKLLDKVLGAFGVKFPKVKGQIPKDMMWDPMWKGLKNSTRRLFDGWLTEAEGAGDGGYIDLSKGINFPYAPTAAKAAALGYPFPRAHNGIDVNYKYGEKLYSTMAGTATGKSGYNGGFGNSMWIKNGPLEAIYGHMSKLNWTGSKKVKPGSYLGKVGSTGDSTGPHLHYEMRRNGQHFDPVPWLKENDGGGTKKAASKWSSDIKRAARNTGVKLSNRELQGIIAQIQRESGGDAGVTQGNIGDINNLRGTPAQGLLQYVPSTFKAYATKGHKNIKNGYHQLRAFFNNSNWRRDLPYGKSGWGPTGRNRGYATGGIINSSGMYNLAEDGHSEVVVPLDPSRANDAMKLIAYAQSKVGADKKNKRPNQMQNQTSTDNGSNESNLMMRMIAELQEQNKYLKEIVRSNKSIEGQPKGYNTSDVSQGLGRQAKLKSWSMGGGLT